MRACAELCFNYNLDLIYNVSHVREAWPQVQLLSFLGNNRDVLLQWSRCGQVGWKADTETSKLFCSTSEAFYCHQILDCVYESSSSFKMTWIPVIQAVRMNRAFDVDPNFPVKMSNVSICLHWRERVQDVVAPSWQRLLPLWLKTAAHWCIHRFNSSPPCAWAALISALCH